MLWFFFFSSHLFVTMPPKKGDGKKDAKKASDLSPEDRMALVEQTLEGEKNNLVSASAASPPRPRAPPPRRTETRRTNERGASPSHPNALLFWLFGRPDPLLTLAVS